MIAFLSCQISEIYLPNGLFGEDAGTCLFFRWFRRQKPGAWLGTTKETTTPFTTPSRPRFEWLEVAEADLTSTAR